MGRAQLKQGLQNDRMYTAKAQLPCDDKDGHYIIRADDELGDSRRCESPQQKSLVTRADAASSPILDKIIKLLGQGTFGKVVEAWDRDAGTTVAVKVIRAIQKYRYVAITALANGSLPY